jgi:hypothetical protein
MMRSNSHDRSQTILSVWKMLQEKNRTPARAGGSPLRRFVVVVTEQHSDLALDRVERFGAHPFVGRRAQRQAVVSVQQYDYMPAVGR